MDRLTDLFLDCYSEEELERIHDMAVEFARLIEGIYVQSGGKGIGMIPTVDDIVRAATRALWSPKLIFRSSSGGVRKIPHR